MYFSYRVKINKSYLRILTRCQVKEIILELECHWPNLNTSILTVFYLNVEKKFSKIRKYCLAWINCCKLFVLKIYDKSVNEYELQRMTNSRCEKISNYLRQIDRNFYTKNTPPILLSIASRNWCVSHWKTWHTYPLKGEEFEIDCRSRILLP